MGVISSLGHPWLARSIDFLLDIMLHIYPAFLDQRDYKIVLFKIVQRKGKVILETMHQQSFGIFGIQILNPSQGQGGDFARSGQSTSFANEDLPQVWYWIFAFEVGVKIIHAFGNTSQ
ncbi:hypothetical protein TURU_061844 [Turdus rufiventris]|nr:hypothetical protein TURU_061844 [Turdus rufiventris]